MGFHKSKTAFQDLFIIQPDVFGDQRGFFQELYNSETFDAIGLGHLSFAQDNLSSSCRGTLRGLHFQAPPFAQGKLVTVIQGEVLDVAVDIRQGSATYGQVFSHVLNDHTRAMVYVPPGFAHGFQVLSPSCLFLYKCTANYHRDSEGGIAWNDPALAIPWREIEPIVSPKDLDHPRLAAFKTPFVRQEAGH
jgi:dTDP-4-dehydrorhamnose 3,5-epimerase